MSTPNPFGSQRPLDKDLESAVSVMRGLAQRFHDTGMQYEASVLRAMCEEIEAGSGSG